jgi:hypothetical protein
MLNPAYSTHSHRHERDIERSMNSNLAQPRTIVGSNNFFPLTTKCCFTKYWTRVWKPVIDYIEREKGGPHPTLRDISASAVAAHVAMLNLVPYRSLHFRATEGVFDIEPVRLVREFAKSIPDDRLVIVARQTKIWDLDNRPNTIVFQGMECRGIHLNKHAERVGSVILEKISKRDAERAKAENETPMAPPDNKIAYQQIKIVPSIDTLKVKFNYDGYLEDKRAQRALKRMYEKQHKI